MIVEIKVPDLGESIEKVEIAGWSKAVGERVERDEPLVDVESEKATVEVPAPQSGVLASILVGAGGEAMVGDVLGTIDTDAEADVPRGGGDDEDGEEPEQETAAMPAAKRVMAQEGIDPGTVTGTGKGGRILKEDAVAAAGSRSPEPVRPEPGRRAPKGAAPGERKETRARMSPIRRTIAARLVQAKTEAALLTTFNEVDMSSAKALRREHGERFMEVHGVKLGFMSMFVKAAVASLGEYPAVNAMIDGDEIVYRSYCDVGIAVGGGKGLVVPVIRNAEEMSFAEVERTIADFGARAQAGTIGMEELEGGTFTISNGGVYGSMLSTPIVNPPQSGILGLHAIEDRPVVEEGEIVIRPVMYVALTYDHRIVDGREAVSFLKGIKERMEAPERMLLDV